MPGPASPHLASKRGTYMLIIGVVLGMLVAGLAIPFVFGTPLRNASTTALNPLRGGSGEATGNAGGPAGPSGAGGAGGTGSGSAGASGGASGGPGGASLFGGPGSGAPAGAGGGAASGGSSGPALGGPGAGPGGAPLTASDRGVTPTTITVAFTIVDLGGVSKVGFSVPGFDPKSQELDDSTFINKVNDAGGIYGRKIVPLYVTYDPTSEQSEDQACITAAEDHSIFAAVDSGGGLSFQAQLCFTQQNHTPLIEIGSFGTPDAMYQEATAGLFTVYQAGARSLANTANLLAGRGVFRGKHIGIIDRDFPGTTETVTEGMVDVLKQLGYSVTERVDMSMDDGTAASQVPVAAQLMQEHGVDTVMLLTDFITGTEFVQAADKRAYRPLYVASDFEAETNDTAVSAMPASFQAVAVTTSRLGEWRVGTPEPAIDAQCRQTYATANGTNLKRSDNSYQAMLESCGLDDLLVLGLRGAGPTLKRPGFTAALERIGSIPYPFFGGFSFEPGKRDGADPVRPLLYTSSCTCWMPAGPFVASKY